MKGMLLFTLAAAALIAAMGGILSLVFGSAADRRAIATSGLLALVVQVTTFAILRTAPPGSPAIWSRLTAGITLRFATLIIYALLALRPLGLPAMPALVSLALFFFGTTLLEPRLLKT